MSAAAGGGPRGRRYPELPVWVVEDHQEVRRGAGAREAWAACNRDGWMDARVALRRGEPGTALEEEEALAFVGQLL